ncbi:MAG TPA: DUF5752 family protein [Candidatus Acidoferrum sp.]|nr:DUF5752 family protein [Candidatus Acidoferrum sp.]
MSTGTRLAAAPFEFYTLAHVTRRGGRSANTLGELLAGLKSSSDESIYHHTIASLYATPRPALNDYAQWAVSGLHQSELAERLATVDSREFETIGDLRRALIEIVSAYLSAHPEAALEPAEETFHFCEGIDLPVPLDESASTLEELRRRIEAMNEESFYLHFVAARARTEEHSNDFSLWVRKYLGMEELARKFDEIDVTESTLEDVRQRILALIDAEAEPSKSFAR